MNSHMNINIIGTGKLGTSLGVLLQQLDNIEIVGIFDKHYKTSIKAQQQIGSGMVCQSITDLPKADMTILTVNDDQIVPCVETLYRHQLIQPGHIVLHCSGLLSSEILAHPKHKNIYYVSVHPLRSFSQPLKSMDEFRGTYCSIEGNKTAIEILEPIFQKLGTKIIKLDSKHKALYHAACVFASNYLVTMSEQALQCFTQAGIEPEIAKASMLHLMQGTIKNLTASDTISDALTGPIQRGDIETLKTHLNNLKPEQQSLYARLGLSTLDLSKLELDKLNQLKQLFIKYL